MYIQKSKSLLVFALVLGLVSMVAAEWRMNPVDEPFSMNKTGVNTSTVQLVTLEYQDPETANWEPIIPSNINESDMENLNYYYNVSSNSSSIQHYRDGYWYAQFEPNHSRGDMIKYNATGTTLSPEVASEGPANLSENLDVGDFELEILTDLESLTDENGNVKAGKEFKLDVRVKNTSSGSNLNDDNVSVEVYYANESGKAQFSEPDNSFLLDNYNSDDEYFFNGEVNFPKETDSEYLMHIVAESDNGGNHGAYSRFLSTAPAIEGEVTEFSSSNGCKTEEMVEECEQNSTISVEYSITNSDAETVNTTLYGFNETGRHELLAKTLSRDGTKFSGTIRLPDLNTSNYMKEMELKFNASNSDRWDIDRMNVTMNTFAIEDRSTPTAYTGNDYQIRIFLGKPYSLESYNKSRFKNIGLEVKDTSGDTVDSFSTSEIDYKPSSGVMSATTYIESSMSTGSYQVETNATNIYNETKISNSGFNVKSQDATFDLAQDNTFIINRLEEKRVFVDIENLVQASNTLEVDRSLPEEIELVNNTVELDASSVEQIAFDINLTELSDESGSVTFTDQDTNYTDTLNIEVDAADCKVEAGNICSETENGIDVTAASKANISEDVDLRNIGPEGENIDFNITVNGDIGPFLTVDEGMENHTLEEEMELTLLYQPEASGTYTGDIIFETDDEDQLSLDTTLEANIDDSDQNPGDQDDTENTGGVEDPLSVTPLSVDLGSVTSGEVASSTITVQNDGDKPLSPLNLESTTYDISSTAINEIPAGSSRDIVLTFNSVEASSGQVTVNAGEQESIVTVAASIQDETSGTDPDNTGEDPGNTKKDEQNSSGGVPILPIAGLIILLLIVGFIFFTSYVPEEGDPLYDVLGEGQ